MTVTVCKWGNSLGVRIPRSVIQGAKWRKGTSLEIAIQGGKVFLRPVEVPSLGELLAQVKPGSRPESADWGKPVGKEVW